MFSFGNAVFKVVALTPPPPPSSGEGRTWCEEGEIATLEVTKKEITPLLPPTKKINVNDEFARKAKRVIYTSLNKCVCVWGGGGGEGGVVLL